jgi:hypothetical protein
VSAAGDAVTVGLSIGVILSFMAYAVSRITLTETAREGRRIQRSMEAAVAVTPPPSRVVLPQERRTREEYPSDMDFDWEAASPQERAEAVLNVLPTHYEDSNGITAKDVAHRLRVEEWRQVTGPLRALRNAGTARAQYDKANRRRRVYWRTAHGP